MIEQVRQGTVVFPLEDGMLQVGSSPGHSFVLSNLSVDDERWLRGLLKRTRVTPAAADQPDRQRSREKSPTDRRKIILRLLRRHGLLITPPQRPTLDQLRVRVTGLDRVGIPLARTLWAMGVRHLDLRDHRGVDSEVEYLFPAVARGTSRATALREEIRGDRIYLSRQSSPHLVVSVENRVIDHGRAGLSLGQDTCHLPIVVDDRSIQVGPLLVPALSCCHLCLDYHQMDRVPGWATLREAIRVSQAPRPSPALAGAAAALAAQLIESVQTPALPAEGGPEDPHWYLGMALRVFEGGVEELRWDPHPRCRCRDRFPS